MAEKVLETTIFGRDVSFPYAERWVGYAVFSLRIVMGWTLFQAGLQKLLDPTWTAAGYLQHAVAATNPFASIFASMAGNPVVDGLVMWGLLLTGVGLIVGGLVRWCAFWGAVMMVLLWASALQGGVLQLLPVENGWIVDAHIVYALLLFGLGAFGAGRILGVDSYIEDMGFVKKYAWLRYLLG